MKGFRTIILNTLAAVPPAIDLLGPVLVSPEFGHFIPTPYYPVYALGVTVMNQYLRTITTTPVGKKY